VAIELIACLLARSSFACGNNVSDYTDDTSLQSPLLSGRPHRVLFDPFSQCGEACVFGMNPSASFRF
jgi:hypothetical protein